MSEASSDCSKVRPVIVLPTGKMSEADIERLRGEGYLVVECARPESIRFVRQITGSVQVTDAAAIECVRKMLSRNTLTTREEIGRMLADEILRIAPLSSIHEIL